MPAAAAARLCGRFVNCARAAWRLLVAVRGGHDFFGQRARAPDYGDFERRVPNCTTRAAGMCRIDAPTVALVDTLSENGA